MSTAVCLQAALRDGCRSGRCRPTSRAADADVARRPQSAGGRARCALRPLADRARRLDAAGRRVIPDTPRLHRRRRRLRRPSTCARWIGTPDRCWTGCSGTASATRRHPATGRGGCVSIGWPNAASYVNTVGLTVDRIGAEARVTSWLQRQLDQQRAELLRLAARGDPPSTPRDAGGRPGDGVRAGAGGRRGADRPGPALARRWRRR